MKSVISIVSYGAGNIGSVANMLRTLGFNTEFADSPAQIRTASKLMLPGVGAFDYGMKRLNEAGLVEALSEAVLDKRVPILGICLGMQLMCLGSEEGDRSGLGWIDANVQKFQISSEEPHLKVPHMGWNSLDLKRDDLLIPRGDKYQRFYFVHSFHVQCSHQSDVVATAVHGQEFVAAFSRGNIHGVQFHPEKSHRYGMALMKRFGEL